MISYRFRANIMITLFVLLVLIGSVWYFSGGGVAANACIAIGAAGVWIPIFKYANLHKNDLVNAAKFNNGKYCSWLLEQGIPDYGIAGMALSEALANRSISSLTVIINTIEFEKEEYEGALRSAILDSDHGQWGSLSKIVPLLVPHVDNIEDTDGRLIEKINLLQTRASQCGFIARGDKRVALTIESLNGIGLSLCVHDDRSAQLPSKSIPEEAP